MAQPILDSMVNLNRGCILYRSTPLVIESSTALEFTVKLSFGCKLQYEVYTGSIMEIAIQTKYIGVSTNREKKM